MQVPTGSPGTASAASDAGTAVGDEGASWVHVSTGAGYEDEVIAGASCGCSNGGLDSSGNEEYGNLAARSALASGRLLTQGTDGQNVAVDVPVWPEPTRSSVAGTHGESWVTCGSCEVNV